MANTNATNYRTVTIDTPDDVSTVETFELLATIISGAEIIERGEQWTVTKDASGTASINLPTPDGDGTAAALYKRTSTVAGQQRFSLTWAASSVSLASLLAAEATSSTPDEVLTHLSAYLPLAGGTMTGNIAFSGSQTVDGVDVSALDSSVTSHTGNTSNPHSVTAAQIDALPEDAAILSKVANYPLAAGDEGKIIECNGTFTITLPDGLDTGFQAIIVNIGSGTITLSAATTLTSKDAATDLANQYGAATVYHAGSNVWRAFGDLS